MAPAAVQPGARLPRARSASSRQGTRRLCAVPFWSNSKA